MRKGSYSTRALQSLLEIARDGYGAETRLLDLRAANVPVYDPDAESYASADMGRAAEYVKWADAFVLASPDYHGSMSGVMKNFLDHFWEEFAGKTFGYIVASHEKGLTVMDQMRTAVRQCYGWSMPYGISINGEQDFSAEVASPRLQKRIRMMARDLAVYGSIIRAQFSQDLAGSEPDTFAARYR